MKNSDRIFTLFHCIFFVGKHTIIPVITVVLPFRKKPRPATGWWIYNYQLSPVAQTVMHLPKKLSQLLPFRISQDVIVGPQISSKHCICICSRTSNIPSSINREVSGEESGLSHYQFLNVSTFILLQYIFYLTFKTESKHSKNFTSQII